jgi:hypothetical protein
MAGKPKTKAKKEMQRLKMETPKWWDTLFESIAKGMSVMEWCAIEEVPYTTVQGRMKREPDLAARLVYARENRALVQADLIEALARKVENEEIRADSGRVAIAARQWLAEKLDPHVFGQRIQADIKVQDVSQVYLDELKALMQAVPKVINPDE